MMMSYDVAIVGASSAGLYAAIQLARGGKRVAIFERQHELAPARRTLIVTPQWQRVLGYLPDDAVLHRISVMEVVTMRETVSVELQDPDLIVERRRFAKHLEREAEDAGVVIYYGHRFQALEPHPEGALLFLRNNHGEMTTVHAGAIIGADGVSSKVAAAAGIDCPPSVSILQAEVALPPGWDPEVTKVWFDVNDTRFFYWLIPESSDRGVVGLVGDDRARTRVLLQRFLQRHDLVPLAYQGAQVAMHHPRLRPWGRVGKAPVLLVGDAAGQVKVSTVGGTVTGLWGAAAAARSLLHGTSYARELRPLKRELDVHWFLRLLLERLDNAGYDALVRTVTPSVREFLSHRNRDEMAGGLWRLPLLQPRFILFGLRLLFRRRQEPVRSTSDRSARVPETECNAD